MKVTFVRHGQTEWNRLGKQQGLADIPLDQTGIEQARKTAQLLKDEAFDCVYCSPLKGAQQLAADDLRGGETSPSFWSSG